MTPKAELFGRIEDYCLELLDAQERQEFEKYLAIDEELREEVELHRNIQIAVTELDILNLRGKLAAIDNEKQPDTTNEESFALIDELSIIDEVTNDLTPEELINSFESLPKVHVYQHEITANENIHQYYKEQDSIDEMTGQEDELNGFDMTGLEGLEEAVLETDILNLRETLQQVSKSIEPQYTVEDIDNFLNGEFSDDILSEFEDELGQNEDLMDEVILHKDVEAAIEETGVMDLRGKLQDIMKSETSWNVSEESIEDFIDGVLSDDLLDEFNAELEENTDLIAEVSLRKHINEAIGESDIQSLRAGLNRAKGEIDKQEIKSFSIPEFRIGTTRFWRNSVAMIIVLVSLAGGLYNGFNSFENSYDKFYQSPTWASERSVGSSLDLIQPARNSFERKDWQNVIDNIEIDNIPKNEAFVAHFYKGLSYQNLHEYNNAIKEYSAIIHQGNNLFVEEAEWYKALCYIKLNNKDEAEKELLAVIERKGNYENDAKAIIRRLKYSFK